MGKRVQMLRDELAARRVEGELKFNQCIGQILNQKSPSFNLPSSSIAYHPKYSPSSASSTVGNTAAVRISNSSNIQTAFKPNELSSKSKIHPNDYADQAQGRDFKDASASSAEELENRLMD